MFIQKMRRTMLEDEAGQALVIGACTMLILALAVMVTIQLGWAIDQRIRVQNAADNGAYSVAAVVARSLNFISFVNRTSISQYVSMMAAQSIAAHVTAIQTALWMLTDLMESISAIICGIAFAFSLCVDVPIADIVCIPAEAAAAILAMLARGLAYVGYTLLNDTWSLIDDLDKGIAIGVKALSWLNNNGMWIVSLGMKDATAAVLAANEVGNFEEQIIEDSAGKCNQSSTIANAYKLGMGALNAADSYLGMFDADSPNIPSGGTEADGQGNKTDDMTQAAERLMAELADGTRVGDGAYGSPPFSTWETHRHFPGASGGLGKALSFIGLEIEGTTRLTESMTPDVFSEGTANQSSASTNSALQNMQNQQNQITAAKQKCDNWDAKWKQDQPVCDADNNKCSADQAPCSNSGDPMSSACATRNSDCGAANSACNTAANDKSNRDNYCNQVSDAAKGQGANQSQDQSTSNLEKGSTGNASSSLGGKKYNYAWSHGYPTTQYTRGGALSSPEYVKATGLSIISGGSPVIIGIQSDYKTDSDHSFHCRFMSKDDPDSSGQDCDNKAQNTCDRHTMIPVPLTVEQLVPFIDVAGGDTCPSYAITKSTVCENEDGRHMWYGVAKYLSFNPKPDDTANFFNQPSYWGFVNKAPEDARFPPDLAFGFSKSGNFTWGIGGTADTKGVNAPGLSSIAPGLNGWARAMVYYHRPGFWTEPPNFFNPFWRAKLAPIAPKLADMTSKVPGVSGLLGGLGLSDKLGDVLTH